MLNPKQLENIANLLRRDSLISTSVAGSGHPTSCLSSVEIMSCLFFHEMSYDPSKPDNPNNDEFILSKGHAAPVLYSALRRAGCIKDNLLNLRKLNSPFEGHPMPSSLSWIKVATGSLGQGLGVGVGMALAAKLQKKRYRTYVLLGDSELAEGSNWEAFQLADHYKLNNLCAIVDLNGLGQTGETMLGQNSRLLAIRLSSFGWNAIVINGHDVKQILSALRKAKDSAKPTAIIAKTIKGRGVPFLENKNGWHGKVLSKSELERALQEIPDSSTPKLKIKKPSNNKTKPMRPIKIPLPNYNSDSKIATREAYGNALAALAKLDQNVITTDGEVSNSTFSERVKENTPKQFIEAYIAEQNMISMALGLSKKGMSVFASSFAAFLSRAHDQLRMAALSDANFTVSGSHAGVSTGEDGPSQMGLEDLALFRSLPNSIVLYPSDAISAEKLTALAYQTEKGIKYIRTTRPKTPIIYSNKEQFTIGDFKVLKSSAKDKLVLIGAGITLHECLQAHKVLEEVGVNSAVIDLYCIKPLNTENLVDFVRKRGNKIIVVEDHYKEGGIGEMLSEVFANAQANTKIKALSIDKVPHSGKTSELLALHKINWEAIYSEAKSL